MPIGSTIDKELCRLATAKEEHARMLDLSHLLQQLWHHHLSQSKECVTPCSKQYNRELADRLAWHLGFRSERPTCRFDSSGKEIDMARVEARRRRR